MTPTPSPNMRKEEEEEEEEEEVEGKQERERREEMVVDLAISETRRDESKYICEIVPNQIILHLEIFRGTYFLFLNWMMLHQQMVEMSFPMATHFAGSK